MAAIAEAIALTAERNDAAHGWLEIADGHFRFFLPKTDGRPKLVHEPRDIEWLTGVAKRIREATNRSPRGNGGHCEAPNILIRFHTFADFVRHRHGLDGWCTVGQRLTFSPTNSFQRGVLTRKGRAMQSSAGHWRRCADSRYRAGKGRDGRHPLTDRLADANKRVAEGEERIRRQRDGVVTLRGSGRSTLLAGIFLAVLEKSQSSRVADRDRLEAGAPKLR